jgi:hypothetical protein
LPVRHREIVSGLVLIKSETSRSEMRAKDWIPSNRAAIAFAMLIGNP